MRERWSATRPLRPAGVLRGAGENELTGSNCVRGRAIGGLFSSAPGQYF
jgi:hypothetical protein